MSRGVPAAIEDWDRACAKLAEWEQKHLDYDSTNEELVQHKRWLNDLLAWGCAILKTIRQPDFADKSLLGSVQERVDHLDDKFAIWHAGMTSEDDSRVADAAYD